MRRLTELALPTEAFEPGSGRPSFEPPPGLTATEATAFGVDLYHHGFLWEAHEVWEGLWQALPREDPRARALRGLIQAAAAGLKARAGRAAGVRSLTAKAITELRAAGEVVELHGWRLEAAEVVGDLEVWGGRGPLPPLPITRR